MGVVDRRRSLRECDARINSAVAAKVDDDARIAAQRACVVHPFASDELVLPDLYLELAETLAVTVWQEGVL
jgi:hypothetical protein